MKLFTKMKDGGPESTVVGYFLIEMKGLFSIALLHFKDGGREAYHTHAFNSISWVLNGRLNENNLGAGVKQYDAGLKPVITKRQTFHRVVSEKNTYVLTFRGPWVDTWKEFIPKLGRFITLTHGRKEVK